MKTLDLIVCYSDGTHRSDTKHGIVITLESDLLKVAQIFCSLMEGLPEGIVS